MIDMLVLDRKQKRWTNRKEDLISEQKSYKQANIKKDVPIRFQNVFYFHFGMDPFFLLFVFDAFLSAISGRINFVPRVIHDNEYHHF